MCDYSLEAIRQRAARQGEQLVVASFTNTCTRGFASPDDVNCAVCLKEGTEIALEKLKFKRRRWFSWSDFPGVDVSGVATVTTIQVGRHRRDALRIIGHPPILIDQLALGQRATVVQLPAPPVDLLREMDNRSRAVRYLAPLLLGFTLMWGVLSTLHIFFALTP